MINKKSYCSNCGKYGHISKICSEPTISVGIICIKLDNALETLIKTDTEITTRYEEINNFNYQRLKNLSKLNFYQDKIKFLLIEKKHSLNYIEFIRGLYNPDDIEKLIKMFKLMSNNEINFIKNKNFDLLWNKLWEKTAKKKIYQKEFTISKDKFNKLIDTKKLDELLSIRSEYMTPEWEIPKGRRNHRETNLECAIREFKEETTLEEHEYILLNNFFSLQDNFIGTNGIKYKHIYYIALLNTNREINNPNCTDNNEVSTLKLCSWNESISIIRPYYDTKIQIINDVFLFILNLCEEYIQVDSDSDTIQKDIEFLI